MSKLKFKLPIFFLLMFPVGFLLLWGYEAYQLNLPIETVVKTYLQDVKGTVLICQFSIGAFLTSFILENVFPKFQYLDPHLQKMVFVLCFGAIVIALMFITCLAAPAGFCYQET